LVPSSEGAPYFPSGFHQKPREVFFRWGV